jgi:membrane protease YdiL (CAAX protease family)
VKLEGIDKRMLAALPICLVALAELLIFIGQMRMAMMLHALNVVLLTFIAIYNEDRIFPVLLLLPLFRLLNAAMPVFFSLTLYSYPLVYAPMFLPIYLILKEGTITPQEAGLTFKNFWVFLPLAVAVGLGLGWGEHYVLRPGMILPDVSISSVIILSLTMILFVGVVEEFVFRSALQTILEEKVGSKAGLVIASIVFGLMHSGYRIPLELFYVCFAGLVFGLLFWLSRSLPMIALAHGITNLSLFLITPVYPQAVGYVVGAFGMLFLLCVLMFRPVLLWPKAGSEWKRI